MTLFAIKTDSFSFPIIQKEAFSHFSIKSFIFFLNLDFE